MTKTQISEFIQNEKIREAAKRAAQAARINELRNGKAIKAEHIVRSKKSAAQLRRIACS